MSSQQVNSQSPHAIVGAGKLVASVWRDEVNSDVGYRFNTYIVDPSSGKASQLFGPDDLPDLLRLCHALTCTFFDDQCISLSVRNRLSELLDALESTGHDEL